MGAERIVVFLLTGLLIAGCAGLPREDAVPADLTDAAVVPGLEAVRYFADADVSALRKDSIDSFWREMDHLEAIGHTGPLPPAVFLAISGGGDNGAFAAGLLNGWTDAGGRPEFKLVTGISTGALIAPFAFLGPEYDEKLEHFYTTVSPKDVVKKRSVFAAFTKDAMADNTPLREVLKKAVNKEVLDAVAREHEKGRMLLIGTVDLDARRAVLWNMTKIAASGDPRSIELFRSVMIASASIPGVFPPVMVDVQAGGKKYQEMHVDGGTMQQVFIYPPSLNVQKIARQYRVERERQVYIIRNARLRPDWDQVERKTMDIAGRAVSSLIETQGIGDLDRIYLEAQRDRVDFNLAYIPSDFDAPHPEEFDTEYMRSLYRLGYDMAVKGYPWEKEPPGF